MSIESQSTPLPPPIAFRLRTLIGVTAVTSLFAATAAPLSWHANPAVQRHLAIAWCTTLLAVAITLGRYFVRTRSTPKQAGVCRYFVRRAWPSKFSPEGPLLLYWIGALLAPFVMYFWFSTISARAARSDLSIAWTIWLGCFIGFTIALSCRPLIAWPVALADAGIVEYGKLRTWDQYFRVEWIADRPNVARLHRLRYDYLFEKDSFVEVAPHQQAEVACFLEEQISLASR